MRPPSSVVLTRRPAAVTLAGMLTRLRRPSRTFRSAGLMLLAVGCASTSVDRPPRLSRPSVVVLGIGQDAGVPQAGTRDAATWHPERRRRVVSLGVVDPARAQRWLFDATPDFPEQLWALDQMAPVPGRAPALSGIFLTHGHIGHYTGLMYLGREAMGASAVVVYAMPRMDQFLRSNGPWDQLVRLKNIALRPLSNRKTVRLNERLTVTPFVVPHRDEYTETVGFIIRGPRRSVAFLPDIDKWSAWGGDRIERLIADVDIAYLDGTFFADGEIPGRAMRDIPHPFITESLERFAALPAAARAKVRFIHLNRSNPALDPSSTARQRIRDAGMHVAQRHEHFAL